MKTTLITASFNSEATIRTAIDSVLAQKGVDIEYIVVDGGSTDGTVDIIKEYSTRSTRSTRPSNLPRSNSRISLRTLRPCVKTPHQLLTPDT